MAPPFRPQDLISLAVDAESGKAVDQLVERMKRVLQEAAFQSAFGDPDERLVPTPDAPGYLTTASGRWQVYVPWPLAFAFPASVLLDGLVAVAERVMLGG